MGCHRSRRATATLAAVSAAGLVAIVIVISRSDGGTEPTAAQPAHSSPVTTSRRVVPTTLTSPASAGATSSLCELQRDPADFYALEEPVTITLPSGASMPIVPGNRLTAPEGITLDGDGAPPGEQGTGASLLWGRATDGGPFAGLQNTSPGDVVTLHQAAPIECTQRWRVVQVVASQELLTPTRPVLRLVGFAPNAAGPDAPFYVEAVPD
jgi:hypothetical protein